MIPGPSQELRQKSAIRRALIIGGSGFVGGAIVSQLGPERAIGTWHSQPVAGLVRFDAAADRLRDLLKTLPNDLSHVFVPFAVSDPDLCARAPADTRMINVEGAIRVMTDAFAAGLVPIFVSSDYVYDGVRPLRTEDEPQAPTTEYGRQKAEVERWLAIRPEPWLVARLSKVLSGDTSRRSVIGPWINDIRSGRPMRSAADQIFSPAFIDDIAGALIKLADAGLSGIYHVAGPQPISRYELNRLLVEQIQLVAPTIKASIVTCSLSDIPFLEPRPLNTSLSIQKLQRAIACQFLSMRDLCAAVARSEFA